MYDLRQITSFLGSKMGVIILKFVRAKLQWIWRLNTTQHAVITLKIAITGITIGVWVFQSSSVTDHWMWSWSRQVPTKTRCHSEWALTQPVTGHGHQPAGRGRAPGHKSTRQQRTTLSHPPDQRYRSEACQRNTEMCHLLRMRFRKIMVTKIEPFYPSWDHSPTYQVWDKNW